MIYNTHMSGDTAVISPSHLDTESESSRQKGTTSVVHMDLMQTKIQAHQMNTPYTFEPPHEKTNNLHGRKQRRRSASR